MIVSTKAQENQPLRVLTNAQQVLDLGIEGARCAPHPVQLRAVVTYAVIRRPWFYVQDATAGVLVICTNESRQPVAGQLVEIAGTVVPGLQAPHVYAANYTVIASASFPVAHRTDSARLAIGEDFGQWVALEGNVVDYFVHPEQDSLLLQEGDQHFVVNISLTGPLAIPVTWLGARVEVQGVCWTQARADGVPTAFRIHTPGTNNIRVLREGPTNLFALPLRTLNSLASQPSLHDQRVRIAGTVTLLLPGESLFLRDQTGAIQARLLKPISEEPYILSVNGETLFKDSPKEISWKQFARPRLNIEPLAPGDRVEVVGTISSAGFGLILSDAEYRRLGSGVAPRPAEVSNAALRSGLREGDLVRWRGRLIDRDSHETLGKVEDLLVLNDGDIIVRALLVAERRDRLDPPPLNSVLEVTGVCSREMDELATAPNIRLLLRGADGLRVLSKPPPWEAWNMGRILAIGAALGAGSLAWIAFLRHRVARRTAELDFSNTRLRAEVEERKRAEAELSHTLATEKELNQLKSQFVSLVSHEFRTPLGVILASADLLSDYLDTLTPEERAEQIADIKQSTRHMADLMEDVLVLGRVESGKMGYYPHAIDLTDFCQRVIDELLSATSRRCPLQFVAGDITAPARGDETILRHILHNLLANGVKYSAPGQPVRLQVERDGDEAVLTVCDRGIGISSEDQKFVFEAFYRGKNVSDRPGSGLGLVVVKRCIELHGGTIELQSTEGAGTTVEVRLPLFRLPGQTDRLHRPPAVACSHVT
ncbi:MAG: HAMP domain-containing sensor histidine kinase [Verrucomicrobiota bacterium]